MDSSVLRRHRHSAGTMKWLAPNTNRQPSAQNSPQKRGQRVCLRFVLLDEQHDKQRRHGKVDSRKADGQKLPRERAHRREAGKKAQAIEHVPAADNDGHGGCGPKRCAGGQQAYEYELHRPGIDGEADAERPHPGIARLCQRGAECKAPKRYPKSTGSVCRSA